MVRCMLRIERIRRVGRLKSHCYLFGDVWLAGWPAVLKCEKIDFRMHLNLHTIVLMK